MKHPGPVSFWRRMAWLKTHCHGCTDWKMAFHRNPAQCLPHRVFLLMIAMETIDPVLILYLYLHLFFSWTSFCFFVWDKFVIRASLQLSYVDWASRLPGVLEAWTLRRLIALPPASHLLEPLHLEHVSVTVFWTPTTIQRHSWKVLISAA